jgi:hypothetical protein
MSGSFALREPYIYTPEYFDYTLVNTIRTDHNKINNLYFHSQDKFKSYPNFNKYQIY